MSEIAQRIEAASTFLLQSPPGEINDVFNDLRVITAADAELEVGILPALRKYNLEQFLVCSLEGKNVLITETASVPGEEDRFLEPRSAVTFAFDHMRVEASDPRPIEIDPETNEIRDSLDIALMAYVQNHYSDGVCAVYPLPDENYPTLPVESEPEPIVAELEPTPEVAVEEEKEEEVVEKEEMVVDIEVVEGEEQVDVKEDAVVEPVEEVEATPTTPKTPAVRSRIFSLHFVANKYNPGNYWTGRWRAVYVVDYAKGTLEGSVKLNTHYYEQGNVQLSTNLSTSHPLPSSSPTASAIINLIKQSESSLQAQLSATSSTFSDETFRNLRRALPKTRSKLDWAKIAGYRLGSELGGAIPGAV